MKTEKKTNRDKILKVIYMKKNFLKTIGMLIVSLLFVSTIISCKGDTSKDVKATEEERIYNVTIKSAESKDVDQIEVFTGTVEGFNTNNISPQMSARIEKTYVEVGDHVYRGQRLAQMDQSNLTQARLQMENNKEEFERTKQLYDVGGASKSEFDARKMAYEVSKTTYNNLLTNTYLISPISGVVTARNYDAGDMYVMGQPLFTVEQIRPVKIKVNAPESLYGQIKKGASVDINLDVYPNETFKGKVYLVYPSLDATTRTFSVEVTIDNANERVRPGMFARVTFRYGIERNVVVPDVAVVKQTGSGDHYVYTVVDGKVVFNKVKLGRIIGTEYEIKSGINEGDMVIIEGQNVVVNGAKVNAKEGEPVPFVSDDLVNKN